MGSLQAEEIAGMGVDLDQALAWHLRVNHYPPVPSSMVDVCIEAIDAINAGDGRRQIPLPANVEYRGHHTTSANVIAEAHHLEAWIGREDS